MKTSLFDFHLPQENIALRPVLPRENAKLLAVGDALIDKHIYDLPNLLREGDALVFNETKVFPAELEGFRVRGDNKAKVTFTLHKAVSASQWLAFARPAKKLHRGDEVEFGEDFIALIKEKQDGEVLLHFNVTGDKLFQAFHKYGKIPLPPYISSKRPQDEQDTQDYQTSFAKHEGSVAAPTAGLHFTNELLEKFKAKGISQHFVTLHVGAGTFLPVKTDDTVNHKMHAEWGEVTAETQQALANTRKNGGRVIAVGTTSLRLLESAKGEAFKGDTSIFITPGYKFAAIDGLVTNFHLPQSTLFMLVSALKGLEKMQAAYAHAIKNDYRFYSYGDACLLLR